MAQENRRAYGQVEGRTTHEIFMEILDNTADLAVDGYPIGNPVLSEMLYAMSDKQVETLMSLGEQLHSHAKTEIEHRRES